MSAESYIPRIAETLERLYAARQGGQNAYCSFNWGSSYVQCLAKPRESGLLCEAQSAISNPRLAPVLTEEKVARLLELGFAPPQAANDLPNYFRFVPIKSPAAFADIAAWLTRVMTDIHGYAGEPALAFKCGFAPLLN